MEHKISVVINTYNEEENVKRAIDSVKWADEIVVCDMQSEDDTARIAQKLGAKVFSTKKLEYVEPARNFAISKVTNEWILILDPDERVPGTLASRLVEIAGKMEQIDYVRIPRKNIIFNKWMQGAMWWPDFNIRFFRKGKVKWGDKIHRPPASFGQGLDLPDYEEYAIVHNNYKSISEFIGRMDRYTDIQAAELKKEGYKFEWKDLFEKPLNEFLSRFFANQGYRDGLHGLALSFLQAFSFVTVYLKLWEMDNFKEQDIDLRELETEKSKLGQCLNYWINRLNNPGNFVSRFIKKFKS